MPWHLRSALRLALGASVFDLTHTAGYAGAILLRANGPSGLIASHLAGPLLINAGQRFALTHLPVLAFGAAMLALFLPRRARSWSWRHMLVLGALNMATLNILALLAAPGALAYVPVLAAVPYVGLYVVLGLLSIFLVVIAFGPARRRGTAWWMVLVVLFTLPHDVLRSVIESIKPARTPPSPRLLLLVVDGARWDDVSLVLDDTLVPRAISHYGVTRKQWRLLAAGATPSLDSVWFVPRRDEFAGDEPDSLLTTRMHQRGLRTAFLIDDPSTTNPRTLGMHVNTAWLPTHGAVDALLIGGSLLPFAGWLSNVVSPVEAMNYWSSDVAYRRDITRALRRHDVVFAHTVTLQDRARGWHDLHALAGPRWLLAPPTRFALAQNSRGSGAGGLDARTLYQVRLRGLLPSIREWIRELAESRQVSVVLTSDHGQDFDPGEVLGPRRPGRHGWRIAPGSAWIPLQVYGTAEIARGRGALSWRDIRRGLLTWTDSGPPLRIAATEDTVHLRLPLVVSLREGHPDSVLRPDIMTPDRLATHVRADRRGWWLDGAAALGRFSLSRGWASGRHLIARNPESSRMAEAWDLYTPVSPPDSW